MKEKENNRMRFSEKREFSFGECMRTDRTKTFNKCVQRGERECRPPEWMNKYNKLNECSHTKLGSERIYILLVFRR